MFKKLFKKEAISVSTSPSISMNEYEANAENMISPKKGSSFQIRIIEEIHNSFYTEVDNLLASAKNANSLDTNKQQLIDKCQRLKSLGFVSTKEVVEAQTEINKLSRLKEENKQKEDLIEAINYFSVKYPQYKFITEESVKKICSKYNLVYGEISKYIGTVPDKNLQQIEEFKISENDECYIQEHSYPGYRETYFNKFYINFQTFNYEKDVVHIPYISSDRITEYKKAPLEIAAPISDFNMTTQEIKNFKLVDKKIEIPDPIVLKPIFFKNKKYYLILTAWGLEASDENVINEKMN